MPEVRSANCTSKQRTQQGKYKEETGVHPAPVRAGQSGRAADYAGILKSPLTGSKEQNLRGWQTILAQCTAHASIPGLCPHIKKELLQKENAIVHCTKN